MCNLQKNLICREKLVLVKKSLQIGSTQLCHNKPEQKRQTMKWKHSDSSIMKMFLLQWSVKEVMLTVLPISNCSFGWGCRIYRLQLCRGVRPLPANKCPGYDTKQSDGEVPVILELWGIWSTLLLPSLQASLWPGTVAPDRALSMG